MIISNEKLEQISALLDGELDNAKSTIDYLLKNEKARDTWQSLCLTRDIAHNNIKRQASASFRVGIMSMLEAEAIILISEVKHKVIE